MLKVKIQVCPDCDHLSAKTMEHLYKNAEKVEKGKEAGLPPCKFHTMENSYSTVRVTIEVPVNRYG